jgi:alcohol dehydrogenase
MLAVLGAPADAACSPEIGAWFGTGLCTAAYKSSGRKPLPLFALATNASSASHLTKYANISDIAAKQKKLIVDEALVPASALFDYELTTTMPAGPTVDGALDAISHVFEVFCGAKRSDEKSFKLKQEIAETAIGLVLGYSARALKNGGDMEAREALGLASDLGGYAIMTGGTSGAHLTSFSLIDIAPHGRACGLMNPYYAVFYSGAIQEQLKAVNQIFMQHGFIGKEAALAQGRDAALSFARGMFAFEASIGAPTKLSELPGFSEEHIQRCLRAARDSDLKMKLQNMPVPLKPEQVDEYMEPILRAAASGDLELVKN